MNWKTLGKAILVMVGLCALIALIALILRVFPFWISLAIAFSAGVTFFYHIIEKDNEFSNDDEEEDEK